MARKVPPATDWRPKTQFDAGPAIDARSKEILEALQASVPHWNELDEWAMVKAWAAAKQALATYAIGEANLETGPRAATVRGHLTAIGSATAELLKALKAMDLRTAELLKKAAGVTAVDPSVEWDRRIRALHAQARCLSQRLPRPWGSIWPLRRPDCAQAPSPAIWWLLQPPTGPLGINWIRERLRSGRR
jgi:hypothetical protein